MNGSWRAEMRALANDGWRVPMINRMLTILLTLFVASAAMADSEGVETVTLLPVSEIRAGSPLLGDWDQISSGQPDGDTLDVIEAAGFTTVIDFRTKGEERGIDEAKEVAARNMTYISFPIAGASDVTYDNAREFDRLLSTIDWPVLVHCQSGNRVGALYALREKLAGASNEEALAVGKAAGLTRLEPVVAERLADQ